MVPPAEIPPKEMEEGSKLRDLASSRTHFNAANASWKHLPQVVSVTSGQQLQCVL